MNLQLATAEPTLGSLETLRDSIPDYAKDIKLNLGIIFTPEGAPDLSQEQIHSIALACAYAVKEPEVAFAIEGETAGLSDALKTAAKSAASIMAMNNIYYRFVHLSQDEELRKLPAKLRMNVIGSPGISKLDFELMCLAVSAINGCGMCIEAHAHELTKHGVSKLALQSTARIAAVIHAAAQVVSIA